MAIAPTVNLDYVATLEQLSFSPREIRDVRNKCLNVMHDYDICKEKVEAIAIRILPNYISWVSIYPNYSFSPSFLRVEPLSVERKIKIYYKLKDDEKSVEVDVFGLRAALHPKVFDDFAANTVMRNKILASKRLVDVMTGKV